MAIFIFCLLCAYWNKFRAFNKTLKALIIMVSSVGLFRSVTFALIAVGDRRTFVRLSFGVEPAFSRVLSHSPTQQKKTAHGGLCVGELGGIVPFRFLRTHRRWRPAYFRPPFVWRRTRFFAGSLPFAHATKKDRAWRSLCW